MRLLLLILFISVSRAHKDDDYHLKKNLIMDIKDGLDYHNNFVHSSMYDNQSHVEPMHDGSKIYKPDWDDLDTRPLPQWYDKAKVGIFLHWGVFSVPSFGSEWFWNNWKDGNKAIERFMDLHYPPNFTYPDFAPMFTAEFFDPDKWARLFADSGARYVVLTSKHHEGFTLFPSKRSFNWNSVEIGPKRDLVGELAAAVRKQNMKFGLYHSLYEWFNPIYLQDKESNFTTRYYPDTKLWPDLKQISKVYKPSVIWSDGDWEAYDTYWNSTGFLAWLYNSSPMREEVVVNDRWGRDIPGHHGDFYNHDDRYNPGVLQTHKWENAFTIDLSSWGFRRNMDISEVLTFNQLLYQLVSTVSCGGNVLINVGPTKEGTISPIFQERLLSLGTWLGINGEAIYDTSPWHHQNDTHNNNTWYTCKTAEYNYLNPVARPLRKANITNIYAIVLKWPEYNLLTLRDMAVPLHSGTFTVKLLGSNEKLNWKITNGLANIELPDKATVVSQNAWVVKFTKT